MAGNKRHSSGSWKVAYADFVTAMMAFFLLMWILNMVPPESKRVLSTYFQPTSDEKGAGGPQQVVDVVSNALSRDTRGIAQPDTAAEQTQRFVIASKLKRILTEDPRLMESSGISADETGVLLRVNNNALFRPGSAQLTPEARRVLEGVLGVLKEYNVHLLVRGHAAEQEHVSSAFGTAWELSGVRAATVASHVLAGGEIIPTRVRAMSYGSSRPLLPEISAENKLSNGRVEFYFHRPDAINFGSGS